MGDGSQNQPSSQFDESDCTQEATPLSLSQNKHKFGRVRCRLISHTDKVFPLYFGFVFIFQSFDNFY